MKSVVDKFNKYARCDIFVGKTGQVRPCVRTHLVRKIKRVFKDIIVISEHRVVGRFAADNGAVLHIYDQPVVVLVDGKQTQPCRANFVLMCLRTVKFLMQTRKGLEMGYTAYTGLFAA